MSHQYPPNTLGWVFDNEGNQTMQRHFNPIDYGFEFTPDGWYRFDRKAATAAARKERDSEAKRMKAEGYAVRKWSHPNQLISKGGIGSGQPHIEEIVTVYGFNAERAN